MKCVPSTLLTSWKFLRRWRPNVADNTLNLSTWRTTALSTSRELYDISWAGWRASNELNLLTSRTILQLTKSETVYKKLARSVRCSCEQLCIWNFSLAPRNVTHYVDEQTFKLYDNLHETIWVIAISQIASFHLCTPGECSSYHR